MPRPRKPTALLELNGAFRNHPERREGRKNEPHPDGPFGEPPVCLSDAEKEAWHELNSIAPRGVLTNADRPLAETYCRLMAKQRKDGIGGRYGLSTGELSQLIQCLIRMGLTPADRSKISIAKPQEASNPFIELANENRDNRVN